MPLDELINSIMNDPEPDVRSRVARALETVVRYGQIDGEHHKTWVLDQVVRILSGRRYAALIRRAKSGADGPDTYGWDVGVPP